jgi:uncharacterized protein YbbC (DUF1343 family)
VEHCARGDVAHFVIAMRSAVRTLAGLQRRIRRYYWSPLTMVVLLTVLSASDPARARLKTGADLLIEQRLALLRGKNVGLITNHTGRLSSGEHLVDALLAQGITVSALFGPEHGIRGAAGAGEEVGDTVDARTGVPVYSLYGNVSKPTPAMLEHVDILVFDIQDVGVRFYTYTTTMALCMEAAAEAHLPFVVLDRPNPLGGLLVDGPVLDDSVRSFVGRYPIPVVYGLTIGELASLINGEGWLANGVRADLTVVDMKGWARSMRWEETGMPWLAPSPNLPTPMASLVYPATCLIEGTNVSEGRGTAKPFQLIGAPWLSGDSLAGLLQSHRLPGFRCVPITFTPVSSKFRGELCKGISLEVVEPPAFRPVVTGLFLISDILRLAPAKAEFRGSFKRLLGLPGVSERLLRGESPAVIESEWQERTAQFQVVAAKYHRYR